MDTTPVTLLERLRRPDERQAWNRFVDLYTPLIFAWARRWGLQEADAADLAQDIFVHLQQKLPAFTYDANRSFRAWLHPVVHNFWQNKGRRLAEAPLGDKEANVMAADDIAAWTDAEYRRYLVGWALQVMPADFQPATWQAFWKCTVDSRSAAEVAGELKTTVAAVRAAKCRVLCRLRQELAGLMD
jgi:RNA polymerase sigma-70 factor (ECF subfamily)